jgi:hypothetical protein
VIPPFENFEGWDDRSESDSGDINPLAATNFGASTDREHFSEPAFLLQVDR